MKFCMIGWCGHSGYLFPGLNRLKDFELAAISSGIDGDDGSAMAARISRNGLLFTGKRYADWQTLLDTEKPEAVSVDGPFHLHGKMCSECAKRGIHVFCEKPVALELEELKEISKAAAKSGSLIVSMVGLRYDPAFWTAHQLVRAGAVGKIKLVYTQKSYRFGKRPDFYKKRELYGGTIPWVGSHAIDWIQWFTGSRFQSVTAFHDTTDNHGYESLEIAAACLFRMENGVLATAGIDILRPEAAPTHGDDRIRIAGTDGVLEVMNGKVHLIDSRGDRFMDIQEPPQSLFEDFIGAIRKENPPPVTTEETIALTKACLLARKAADSRNTEYFS